MRLLLLASAFKFFASFGRTRMAGFSHALFIDESGNGVSINHINRFWVTAGVAFAFDQKASVDRRVRTILRRRFFRRVKELKGSLIPDELSTGSTSTDVARDVQALLVALDAHVWVVATSPRPNPLPNFPIVSPSAKQITRQLLLERVNGFLNLGYYKPNNWLLIWDISERQELTDFSRSVATFRNAFSKQPLNLRLAPAALGGLSHDWTGLQIADVVANFALHKIGAANSTPGTNSSKANDFDLHFYPCLQQTAKGGVVGWKFW